MSLGRPSLRCTCAVVDGRVRDTRQAFAKSSRISTAKTGSCVRRSDTRTPAGRSGLARHPMLNVANSNNTVIPPSSIVAFHWAAASPVKELLWYNGDQGVAL
jgi:hypothetical protein